MTGISSLYMGKKGHPIQYAKNNLSNNHFTLFLNNKMIYLKVLNSKQIFFALKNMTRVSRYQIKICKNNVISISMTFAKFLHIPV